MDVSEDGVCKESKDVQTDGSKGMVNGETDMAKPEDVMNIMAEDDRMAVNGKAKDCVKESVSSPGKIGYLTFGDGCLTLKTADSDVRKEKSSVGEGDLSKTSGSDSSEKCVLNGFDSVEKEKASDTVEPSEITTCTSDLPCSGASSTDLSDCTRESKDDNSKYSCEIQSSSCISKDHSEIKSSDSLEEIKDLTSTDASGSNPNENLDTSSPESTSQTQQQQTSVSFSHEVKLQELTQETVHPSPSIPSNPDNLQQGSSVEEEEEPSVCPVSGVTATVSDSVSVCGDAEQCDAASVTSDENGENIMVANSQPLTDPSGGTMCVNDQIEMVSEKAGKEQPPCDDATETRLSVSEQLEVEQKSQSVDLHKTEQSEDTEKTEQSEHMEMTEQSEHKKMTEQSEHKKMTEQSEHMETIEQSENTEIEKTGQSERVEMSEQSERVEMSEQSERVEMTEQSEQSEHVEMTEQSERVEMSEQSEDKEMTEQSEDKEMTEKSEHTEKIEESEDEETTEQSEHVEKTEKSQDMEMTEQSEHTEKTEQSQDMEMTEQSEHVEKTEQSEDMEMTEQSEHTEKREELKDGETTEQSEHAEKTEQSEDMEMTEQSEHTEKTEELEDGETTEQSEHAEKTEQSEDMEPEQSEVLDKEICAKTEQSEDVEIIERSEDTDKEVYADFASKQCKSSESEMSADVIICDGKPDQPSSESLPLTGSTSERCCTPLETSPSRLSASSHELSAITDGGEQLLTDSTLTPSSGKSTARKSTPSGKSKLSKSTARKTGQPQATTKVTYSCSNKDSGEGTIKIFNLHPNSNITLKLSELEKVLKAPKVKDASKVNASTGTEIAAKKEYPPAVTKEIVVGDEESIPSFEPGTSDNCLSYNCLDGPSGAQSSLKLQHKRRRKKGGTYDFPGGKKYSKKKKGCALSSGMSDGKDDGSVSDDSNSLRQFSKKSSPHKQYTVTELFKKSQPLNKQHTDHDTLYCKSSDIPLSGKTVSQILQERRIAEGIVVSDSRTGQTVKSPHKRKLAEATPGSHTELEEGKKHMVQKLFVTKDGFVSSVKVEDASERENAQHGSVLKRKFSAGSVLGQSGNMEIPAAKKPKMSENEGSHSSLQPPAPMVMVVAQHSQNPGLRSILPKPHMATAIAVTASSAVSASPTSVMVSAGQKLLLTAPPLLMKPGTKVALVPVSVTGKSSISLLPTSMMPGSKGRAVPASVMTTLPKVLKFPPSVPSFTSKSTDALRSLLSPSNGPRLKTVSMVPGSIPAVQRFSIPSSVVSAVSIAQARLLTASSLSSSSSSSSLVSLSSTNSVTTPSSKSVGVGNEGKMASALPNGLLPVTPPKTPEGEAIAEGMAAAPTPDSDTIPLCCCKIVGTFFNKLSVGVIYCQALDSVDGKALGCCNKVSNLQLVRPGVKIPFMAVCEVHRKRLKLHQCCPGCGHFCTQGKFYQCRQDGSTVHNFHRQCQTERDGRLFCPHCGEESGQVEVSLALNEPQPNQSSEQIRANLRKSLSKARMTPSIVVKKKSSEAQTGVSFTLPNSKTISSEGLQAGPDRESLEKLMELCVLKTERPKKYRVLPKNLYQPASDGDIDRVFYMLMDGMDPNQTCEEEDKQTVLHAAVYSGNLALVYLLVQAGACIHTPDKTLKTPLMVAAENGYLAILQFLVKAGARLDDRGEEHMTCLHCAAKAGHLDIIHYILDVGAVDVNAQDEGGWTPIMWATESKLVNIVKFLVSRGGDPNKKDNEENNALHWAAFAGSVEIAELFLDLGCELDSPNEHGDRPLHIASRLDHYEVVVVLLARGASVDLKNNKDETPVSCCAFPSSQVCMALKVNKQLRSFAAKLSRPEKLAHRDLSVGREKNPIACVNAVDDEPCPTDYLYVNSNVETQDLHINNVITSLQSCRCKDDCSSVFCVCSRSSVKCWFDKYGRLVEDFNLLDPPHIFECNRACRCWVNCNNRVVQNGITGQTEDFNLEKQQHQVHHRVRMQVFRTQGRGWGVRSLMDIPKGTFICEYIGELISDQEADRREDDSYLFDLDNKDGDTYCLDARKYGNVARFINHLCEPNLVPVKVFVEHQDLRFPRICFFSSRNIKAYEEFGFDYGEKFWIIKWKQFTCACGSPKCKYSTETIKRTLEEYRLRHEDEEHGQDAS